MSSGERQRLAAELKRAMRERVPVPVETPPVETSSVATPRPVARSAETVAPISFNAALLRAVLTGHKTQTRRPIRPAPVCVRDGVPIDGQGDAIAPLARPGERLWVREGWARREDGSYAYAIDGGAAVRGVRWIASRFMPREAARTFLCVRGVEVTRLSSITDADALAEGAAADPAAHAMFGPRAWFFEVWDSIYGETEFASAHDPWVWVTAFERACV